jgi:hypothetical protein
MKWLFYPLIYLACPLGALSQSYISAMADRYQYGIVCLNSVAPGMLIGRHPAGIMNLSNLISRVYGENSLVAGGMTIFGIQTLFHVAPGNISLLLDYSGAGDFAEMQTGIGYGRNLGPAVQIGARFNYYRLRIKGYGSTAAFPAECGAVFQVTPGLRTSIYIYNFMGAQLKSDGSGRIPTVVRLGTGYAIAESLGIVLEIIKEYGRPVSFQPILFYQAQEKLFFRGGVGTGTRSVFVSGGYVLGRMKIYLSTAYQGLLGWTAGLGLEFSGTEKKSR